MIPESFEKNLLAYTAVLWLFAGPLWAASYVDVLPSVPEGTEYGWTSFPGAPSRLGKVYLVAPDPQTSEDSLSGVWTVERNSWGGSTHRKLLSFRVPIDVFPADIDSDGYKDIVVNFRERTLFRVYFSRSDRSERYDPDNQLIVEGRLPLGSCRYIGAGDLNGDGLAEILAFSESEADSSVLTILWAVPSDSAYISFALFETISFQPPLLSDGFAGRVRTGDYLFGDYDGDGLNDFVFMGYLFLNKGDRSFELIKLTDFTFPANGLFGAADFNGDGLTELLISKAVDQSQGSRDEITISGFQPGAGFYEKLTLRTEPYTTSFQFGEFTGDRYPDLAVYNNFILTVFRGTAEGGFTPEAETWITGLNNRKILGPLDWNHDGLLDWLFLTPGAAVTVKVQQAPLFVDKTAEVGLDFEMAGYAAAVADFNNDGYPDIYVVNGSPPNALFAGNADGTFRNVAEEAGVALVNDGISCAWGDYNNDGFVDLFVPGMRFRDKLFRNNGDGTFSDSSSILGSSHPGQRVTSACWGDVNNDGWLDLLLGNYDGPDLLLYNNSGQSFLERTPQPGNAQFKTESAVLVDVNLDGRLDVVTLNADGPTRLILSMPMGFKDVSETSGLNPDESFKKFGQSQSWGDFNGDSYADLYITRAQDVDMLFLNRGKQPGLQFDLVWSGHHSPGKYGRMAASIADFDADGVPDLLITRTSQFGILISSPADLLFLGDPSKDYPQFEESLLHSILPETVPADNSLGLDRFINSSFPLAADFDLDGDLDLLFVNYLPDNQLDLFQGSPLPLSYLQNQSQVNDNLVVKLRRTNNRSVVGTRVVLNKSDKRFAQVVSGGSGRIQTGDALLFSLGSSGTADSLKVYWPQGRVYTYREPLYPGILEILDDRMAPVITPLELPGLIPAERPLPVGFDSFYVTVLVEDDSPVDSVFAELFYHMSSEIIPGVKTDTQGIYRVVLPAPEPGDSLRYRILARDIYHNVGVAPAETAYRFYHLKVDPNYIFGDVNQDGMVNIVDLVRLAQIMGEAGEPPTEIELNRADINRDGKVDNGDLWDLIRYYWSSL